MSRIIAGLQILHVEAPDNNKLGFCYIQKALGLREDLENPSISPLLAGSTDRVSKVIRIVTEGVEEIIEDPIKE